jgi:uncharacterized membrane protein
MNPPSPERLKAFSDGVMAILITITVLEFKVPVASDWMSLQPLLPLFLAYIVSFQTIGTYWNNHHHLLHATKHTSTGIMWANLHLLFWLSFIPFATGWLGVSSGAHIPTAIYAIVLFMCAVSYMILQYFVIKHSDDRDHLWARIRSSNKGLISLVCHALAIVVAFFLPVISYLLILFVSAIWFIPDRRIVEEHRH